MAGFTVVLIDDDDGSAGDFVYVEAFPDFDSLLEAFRSSSAFGMAPAARRVVSAAREIAEREREPERRSTIYGAIE